MEKTIYIRTVKTLSKVLSICRELSFINKSVLIDLTNTRFIDSNLTAVLGAYIKYMEFKSIDVLLKKPDKPKVFTTLCKNNFLPFLDSKYRKFNDRTQSVIEFQHFDINDVKKQQNFFKLLNDGLLAKRGLVNLSNNVLKEVSKSIIELFSNSASHSNSKIGVFCAGQFFEKYKKLDITIVDIGVGIPYNVEKYLNTDIPANKAIEWSTKRLHSTREDVGGLGLHLLKELITLTKGKLEIVSSTGYYYIIDGKENSKVLEFDFPGTIVNIEFKINNKYYSFKGEKK